jgi:hypothetical protein
MNNLLQQAINCDDADRAARIIPRRARHIHIGEWLKTEARYLAL